MWIGSKTEIQEQGTKRTIGTAVLNRTAELQKLMKI
jgi:hypothetical protein